MRTKRLLSLLLALLLTLSLAACGAAETGESASAPAGPDPAGEENVSGEAGAFDLDAASWEEIVDAARGTTVTFYGWGGDENRNNWLNSAVADYVAERYDITLEVVGMNIEDILAKLAGG